MDLCIGIYVLGLLFHSLLNNNKQSLTHGLVRMPVLYFVFALSRHVCEYWHEWLCCCCMFQGKCQRKDPPCKYLHPPQHLKEQLLQNGRNNLILKNLQMQAVHQATIQPIVPGMVPAVVSHLIRLPASFHQSYAASFYTACAFLAGGAIKHFFFFLSDYSANATWLFVIFFFWLFYIATLCYATAFWYKRVPLASGL